MYAIVYFDASRVKIRGEGPVKNKAVYLAIVVCCSGHKEALGIWIEQTEGAQFRLRVMTEVKGHGANDILIAVVDELKGFPEAIGAVFTQTPVKSCVVHLIRYSLQFPSWTKRKAIAAALKPICKTKRRNCAVNRLHDDEYRVLYVAKCAQAIYVLHAFVKKTQRTTQKACGWQRSARTCRRQHTTTFSNIENKNDTEAHHYEGQRPRLPRYRLHRSGRRVQKLDRTFRSHQIGYCQRSANDTLTCGSNTGLIVSFLCGVSSRRNVVFAGSR